MFCHKCGTQIDEGSAFCHKCGAKVVYEDASSQSSDNAKEQTPLQEPDFSEEQEHENSNQIPVEEPSEFQIWWRNCSKPKRILVMFGVLLVGGLVIAFLWKFWEVLLGIAIIGGFILTLLTGSKEEKIETRKTIVHMVIGFAIICLVVFAVASEPDFVSNIVQPGAGVRNAYLSQYSETVTIEDAFSGFFENEKLLIHQLFGLCPIIYGSSCNCSVKIFCIWRNINMYINRIFELSMPLNNEQFQQLLAKKYDGTEPLEEVEDGYIDRSLSTKGMTVIYRDSQYKKRVRLIVNTHLLLSDPSDTGKLLRKLDKRIGEYFNFQFKTDDFTLYGMSMITDIDVRNWDKVMAYLKVLRRVGKVKGFSPTSYDGLDEKASFCLSGNSNAIDFLLYNLEQSVAEQIRDNYTGHKKMKAMSIGMYGILRAEVKLKKPKAIRAYTNAEDTVDQIIELSKKCQDVFFDTFTRIIPFGDFYKKNKAVEIVYQEVKDSVMRRKMLRLLALIPEKKSLYLAQKAMNCRNIEKVMDAFSKINLSPVTISKRHDEKYLKGLYGYLLYAE